MNVSKEADAAFVLELRREDPSRSARLMKSVERALGHGSGEHWIVGACIVCGGNILDALFLTRGQAAVSQTWMRPGHKQAGIRKRFETA